MEYWNNGMMVKPEYEGKKSLVVFSLKVYV
jgi:hypothetical protein